MNQFEEIKYVLTQKLKMFEKMKKKVEKSLSKAPNGALVISSSHGTMQYYHKLDDETKKRKYIGKENTELITSLAQKDYNLSLQKEIEKQEKQIQKVFYLEHFGMMDDIEYCEKALLKIKDYARNGIIIGKNLIVTFEAKNVPLDMNIIETILKELL